MIYFLVFIFGIAIGIIASFIFVNVNKLGILKIIHGDEKDTYQLIITEDLDKLENKKWCLLNIKKSQ